MRSKLKAALAAVVVIGALGFPSAAGATTYKIYSKSAGKTVAEYTYTDGKDQTITIIVDSFMPCEGISENIQCLEDVILPKF